MPRSRPTAHIVETQYLPRTSIGADPPARRLGRRRVAAAIWAQWEGPPAAHPATFTTGPSNSTAVETKIRDLRVFTNSWPFLTAKIFGFAKKLVRGSSVPRSRRTGAGAQFLAKIL